MEPVMAKQKIILRGSSWDASNGDERSVDEETAADLVENGLADYPPNSVAAKKAAAPARKRTAKKVAKTTEPPSAE
jgi:hypothetical protein